MLRSSMMGLPVMAEQSGRLLGRVSSLWYAAGDSHVKGVGFVRSGWFARRYRVPWDAVRVLGQDVVIVSAEGCQRDGTPEEGPVPVFRQDGSFCGLLGDVELDGHTGRVTALMVEQSWLDDLRLGPLVIRDMALCVPQHGQVLLMTEAPSLPRDQERM